MRRLDLTPTNERALVVALTTEVRNVDAELARLDDPFDEEAQAVAGFPAELSHVVTPVEAMTRYRAALAHVLGMLGVKVGAAPGAISVTSNGRERVR